jgi:predicted RNA-binding protein with PIN domain
MRYLIDGHNLIPKLGMRLDALDDEERLVEYLLTFCRLSRSQVEVFFDGAPPGQPASRSHGAVTARFVRKGFSADAAIETRLKRLGSGARGCSVVSSDRRVQAAGRAVHARVVTAEEFAQHMLHVAEKKTSTPEETSLTPGEVEEWLSLFKARKL